MAKATTVRGNQTGKAVSGGRSAAIKNVAASALSQDASARFEKVMQAAERSGLLEGKNGRIGGRVSPVLVREAKRRTGITADTDLIAFALANVALEDNFASAFREARGTVDPELKLGL